MSGGFSVFTQGVLMDFFPLSALIKSFSSCSSVYLTMYVCSVTLKCLTLKQIQNDNISSNTDLNFFYLFVFIVGCARCKLSLVHAVFVSQRAACVLFFFFFFYRKIICFSFFLYPSFVFVEISRSGFPEGRHHPQR